MPIQNHVKAGGEPGEAPFYPYKINQSLRFNDNAYLSWTPSVSGNRQVVTYSRWFKRGDFTGSTQYLVSAGTSADNVTYIRLDSSDRLSISSNTGGGSSELVLVTTQLFRDPSAHYHVTVSFDTTQAVASDRVTVEVNGEIVTDFDTEIYPSQNYDLFLTHNVLHTIGRASDAAAGYFNGYDSEEQLTDGLSSSSSDFGEFKNGVWIPKAYTGSYGTNGFHLDFADSGDIGNDVSGNNNDWTVNNLVASDVVPDSPTNNFCTLNTLDPFLGTLSQGNLQQVTPASGTGTVRSTFSMLDLGYYCEAVLTSSTGGAYFGIVGADIPFADARSDNYYLYRSTGTKYSNGAENVAYGDSYTTGDVVGILYDGVLGELTFYKNGVSQGVAYTGLVSDFQLYFSDASNSSSSTFVVNFGQDSTFAGNTTAGGFTDANGIGDFKYQPPVGALALCAENLPEPVFSPAGETFAEDNFDIALYDGNGATQSITDLTFQPDYTWGKERSSNSSSFLVDVLRGPTKRLVSNNPSGETDSGTAGITSFDPNGFSLGGDSSYNENGQTYVAWNWKMGGAGVVNNDGSLQSTVSANVEAGQSVVITVGDGTTATVGHGLEEPLELILGKSRDTSNDWPVYSKVIGATQFLELNTNIAATTSSNRWGDTEPTNAVFTVSAGGGASTNVLNENYVFYCFHSVEGYSKFGSYEGNGDVDGPFVYLGFRPRYVLIRSTNSRSWKVWDTERSPYNVVDLSLTPNDPDAESVADDVDILSNGFKIRTNNLTRNATGETFIFAAFAENPFKYANAR